jgi:hypothetical protein
MVSKSSVGAKQLRYQNRAIKGKRPARGRAKGQPNYTTRLSREAITEALCAYGSDGRGKDGMVGFCLAAIRKDIRNGVTMLNMITPRHVDATITRTDVIYKTIAQLDQDLAQAGLPTSGEVFQIDYKGTSVLDPAE